MRRNRSHIGNWSLFPSLLVASVAALLTSNGTAAQNSQVLIDVAGEATTGALSFELVADENVLGSVNLQKTLNTSNGVHLNTLEGAAFADHVEQFSFNATDITTVKALKVVLGGASIQKQTGGTILFVRSVRVGNQTFGPWSMFISSGGEASSINDNWVMLDRDGSILLYRPLEGWPKPGVQAANPVSESPSTHTLAVTSVSSCTEIAPVTIEGFAKNASAPPPSANSALADFVRSIGDRNCRVSVTGFASGGDSDVFRKKLGNARVEAVVLRLVELGILRERLKTDTQIGGRQVRLEAIEP